MPNSTSQPGTPAAGGARSQLTERRRRQLEELADQIDILPGSFVVPMRVLELHRDQTADLARYAEVLIADSSLTARILSLVNSAAFAPVNPVTRLTQAVSMIGLRNLMPLVFGTSLAGIYNSLALPTADRRLLWRGAILKGTAAREYCLFVGNESAGAAAEEAFLAGLLQDVALPVILSSDRAAWPEIMAALDAPGADERHEREMRLQGIDHGELGERVLGRLGVPRLYQVAARFHHGPMSELFRRLPNEHLASAVGLAGGLPHRLTQLTQPVVQRMNWQLRTLRGPDGKAMEPETSEALVARIASAFEEMLRMLGDADENSIAFRQFMQGLSREVTRCLHSAIGGATAEISSLKSREARMADEMEELREQAAKSEFDPLTGVLNRRGFDGRVVRWLEIVREHGLPCILGYVDLDDFKQINDRLGHATGDAALVLMSRILLGAVTGRGMVARLGGDEFAFLYVPKGGGDIGGFIEQLTGDLAEARVTGDGRQVRVGASVGLLRLEPQQQNTSADEALKRADELMYTVKKSGKGRCTLARLDDDGSLRVIEEPPGRPSAAPAA